MRIKGYFRASDYNSDNAFGFGDPGFSYDGNISAIGIHFQLLLHFITRNAPYSYFRSTCPNFVKSGSHVPLPKEIISRKVEADPTIRYGVMKLFCQTVMLHSDLRD